MKTLLQKYFSFIFAKTNLFVLLCCGFVLSIHQSGFAQQKMWQSLDNEPVILGNRQIIPQKYKVFSLNLAAIKVSLGQAPMENTSAAQAPLTQLEIPLPNGNLETFVVQESPIMEPALAKQFPQIKTYSGYSITNKSTTARFDVTQFGFHAIIFSSEGTFFIDPYSNTTTDYYICYDKKDFTTKKSFTCGVGGIIQPMVIDTPNQNQKNKIALPNNVNIPIGDGVLRTYRLALAVTGEYSAFFGGTVAGAAAGQVTTMNRVNGIFLKDFAVKMILIANNNSIIYTNAASDPYTNNDGDLMLTENINNLNAVITSVNYDIGHVFSTGGGGVAYTPSVCTSFKGGGVTGSGSPVGDAFDVDYVAHEMGHQFGGNHTQNNDCQRNDGTAFEPGSGSTIMGYAGICSPNVQSNSDAYFHVGNLAEMHSFITGSGNSCAAKPAYTNAKPVISSNTASQIIPKGTPFFLTSTATDANGNASLTYCWEQMDNQISTQAPQATATNGPNFRSFNPTTNGTRYLPRLSDLVNNTSPTWEVLPTVGRTLSFRLVVRDNAPLGGANDRTDNIILTVNGTAGPFVVTNPTSTGINWSATSTQTVTWAVASTDVAPISCTNIDILLSTDGGLTYPTTLASNIANNGSAIITVPNVSSTTARIMIRGTGRAFFDISNSNFTITIPPCPSTLTLTVDVTSGSVISKAVQTITATNKVFSPAIVTYQAGNSISLNTGFEAKIGSVFLAKIAGCL